MFNALTLKIQWKLEELANKEAIIYKNSAIVIAIPAWIMAMAGTVSIAVVCIWKGRPFLHLTTKNGVTLAVCG